MPHLLERCAGCQCYQNDCEYKDSFHFFLLSPFQKTCIIARIDIAKKKKT
jgi:hypothetical protein